MKIFINNKFCDRFLDLPSINHPDIHSKGFIDSHGHVMWLGMKNLGLDLEGLKSLTETLEKVKSYNSNSEWIVGRGWDETLWSEKFNPSPNILDEIYPNKPVYLKRIDGHAAWCNSKALENAGINKFTPNPEGGEIKKDLIGNLTGILVDNAMELINDVLPKEDKTELQNYILSGIETLSENGVIATCDMDVHLEWYDAWVDLAKNNKLKINVKQYLRGFDGKWKNLGLKPHKIGKLNIAGLKYFADGAIGSRGAKLFQDYSDDKGNRGLYLIDEKALYNEAKEGCEAGWEIAVHAIGDEANWMVLNVFEKLRNDGFKNVLRIEHAQMVKPKDLKRFLDLDVEAHIQPIHCTSDNKMAETRLGERVNYSYPWKSLTDLKVKVFGGSDYPIESCDPLLGLEALLDPKIKWQISEIPAINEALKIYSDYSSS